MFVRKGRREKPMVVDEGDVQVNQKAAGHVVGKDASGTMVVADQKAAVDPVVKGRVAARNDNYAYEGSRKID